MSVPIQRRAISTTYTGKYFNDGTGRDSYINEIRIREHRYNPKQRLHTQSFDTKCRMTHYQSDGGGRDQYVGVDDGGQSTQYHWRNHYLHRFVGSLRQNGTKYQRHPYKIDLNQTQFCKRLSQPKTMFKVRQCGFSPDIKHGDKQYVSKFQLL